MRRTTGLFIELVALAIAILDAISGRSDGGVLIVACVLTIGATVALTSRDG